MNKKQLIAYIEDRYGLKIKSIKYGYYILNHSFSGWELYNNKIYRYLSEIIDELEVDTVVNNGTKSSPHYQVNQTIKINDAKKIYIYKRKYNKTTNEYEYEVGTQYGVRFPFGTSGYTQGWHTEKEIDKETNYKENE